MPLLIIRGDITKIKCDAIVNAANNSLLGGGGVDGAIHRAAGRGLLEECRTLGGCATGDAKITGAYDLPCKYVIHTVGPIWRGGKNNEERLLRSCYKKSFALAKQYECESIAFPLISAGAYGYPKNEAFSIAVEEAKDFLENSEMTVYIVVFGRERFEPMPHVQSKIIDFIDDNYEDDFPTSAVYDGQLPENFRTKARRGHLQKRFCADISPDYEPVADLCENLLSPEIILPPLEDTFTVALLKLIDIKGMTDIECYKKANVSRQTWYKIMNDGDYKPSKNTIIAFAIALQLDYDQTNALLATAGFTLSRSKKFDVIIEYFVRNGFYDIYEINQTLFYFDQPCLGA